jgi:hypothetical protein
VPDPERRPSPSRLSLPIAALIVLVIVVAVVVIARTAGGGSGDDEATVPAGQSPVGTSNTLKAVEPAAVVACLRKQGLGAKRRSTTVVVVSSPGEKDLFLIFRKNFETAASNNRSSTALNNVNLSVDVTALTQAQAHALDTCVVQAGE